MLGAADGPVWALVTIWVEFYLSTSANVIHFEIDIPGLWPHPDPAQGSTFVFFKSNSSISLAALEFFDPALFLWFEIEIFVHSVS